CVGGQKGRPRGKEVQMDEAKATAERAETGLPERGTWKIDPAHSGVGFVARHMMVSKVRGGFGVFSGTIEVGDSPETSSVEVEIDAASVQTGNEGRDQHLRSPDFLDVETYPRITFRSTRVERTGDSSLRVEGDLTIRDVTKPVTLDAHFHGMAGDPLGNTRIGFSASTE